MDRKRKIIMLVLLGIVGCKSLPPECKSEYAHTISHCSSRPRHDPTPAECEAAGGVQIYVDRDYKGCASRDTIDNILRGRT